jgi:exopolysaccharide biosynthesis polyprenyl glycosylphosphotransferase
MVEEKEKIISQLNRLVDLCLTICAFAIAYLIRDNLAPEYLKILKSTSDYKLVGLMIVIIWYLVFERFQIHSLYKVHIFHVIFWKVLKAVSFGMLVLILCMYIFGITTMSRIIIVGFYLINIGLICFCKFIVNIGLTRVYRKDANVRKVLVVGSKTRAKNFIDNFYNQNTKNVSILGCLEIDQADIGREVASGVKVIDTVENLETILLEKIVDELIFAMPLRKIEKINNYLHLAELMGISIRILPDFQIHQIMKTIEIGKLKLEDIYGMLTMSLHTTPVNYNRLFIKSAFDYIFAVIAITICLPFCLLVFVAIRIMSPGPVLFKQERCGLNGRRFVLYKFRTMTVDAESQKNNLRNINEAERPVFKVKNDPRIIPVIGTLLRRTGFDEMPQLINVLKGEMSIVGPRPPLPEEVEKYELWQRRRLSMKPGLTCLWQINPKRHEIGFKEWMDMDLGYIDNWSLILDFKILFSTVRSMLLGAGR